MQELFAGTFWLLDTGIPVSGVRSLSLALNERPFADLNDATLADEDTNSILREGFQKHRKNCECCPVDSIRNSCDVQDCLFNCQNGKSNCLNCEKLSSIVKNCNKHVKLVKKI